MKSLKVTIAAILATLAVFPAVADAVPHQHQNGDSEVVAEELTKATVRRIDVERGKITLKHEAIKSVGMPAMTMGFLVEDKALLEGLSPGDSVRFNVQKRGSAMVITAIEVVHPTEH